MVDRILLGKRGTEYGLWISKPGYDVKSATAVSTLMVSPGMRVIQWIARGQVNVPAKGSVTVNVGNTIGFKTLVSLHSTQYGNTFIENDIRWAWLNNTQFQISYATDNPNPDLSSLVIDYAILGVPLG